MIISRFNDHLGEHLDTIFNLPGRYEELSEGLSRRLEEDFSHYGLGLSQLYISSITPPAEVQKAIDDKSRVNVFDDLNKLLKMKAAMLCRNCDSVWEAKNGEFIRTPYNIIPSSESGCYIPFWKISAAVEGLTLNSYADLARLANIPKAVREEWKTQTAYFWAPAFVARPQIFLRLAQQLTAIGPETAETGGMPAGKLLPVTLGSGEACESIYVTIAQMAVPKNRYFPIMNEVKIHPVSASLVFIPFNSGNLEYLQPQMNLCIPRNTFREI